MARFAFYRSIPAALAMGAFAFAARPSAALGADPEAAQFARCSGPGRVTCVVDGDTIWYRGTKIRLADINTPKSRNPRARRRLHWASERPGG